MSWYHDPQIFICNAYNSASQGFNEYRCKKDPNGTVHVSELQRISSGVHKGRDFDALLAYLINFFVRSGAKTWRIVNCQGLAILWEQTPCNGTVCSWSREPLDSPYYRLPGITPPVDAEKEALKRRVSDLLAEISPLKVEVERNKQDKTTLVNEKKAVEKTNSELKARNSTLEADVRREKTEKKDLEKKVSELTLKLQECCGSADGEPWKSGRTVPNDWVPFEDLDVLNTRNITSLKMIKASGALKFAEDNTTNVQASHFYGGIYLAAVNVEELIPDKDEARFDQNIWSSYKNAGTSYAARKLF